MAEKKGTKKPATPKKNDKKWTTGVLKPVDPKRLNGRISYKGV